MYANLSSILAGREAVSGRPNECATTEYKSLVQGLALLRIMVRIRILQQVIDVTYVKKSWRL